MVDGLAMPRTMFFIFFGCLKYIHEYGDIKKKVGTNLPGCCTSKYFMAQFRFMLVVLKLHRGQHQRYKRSVKESHTSS